jgi:hypothetical protein
MNQSLGETPFLLNHCRYPALPHKVLNPAVEDFTQHLQNRILEARYHISWSQETRAKLLEQGMRPSQLKVDLVLLSTEHYNLQLLPEPETCPKWLGPLKVLEVRGSNTVPVTVEIPQA